MHIGFGEEVFSAIQWLRGMIHINAGIADLVLSYLVIKRKAHSLEEVRKPSSIKFMVLGSALLWFGWFGFNGGSQLAADGIAANAIGNQYCRNSWSINLVDY